jgi:hypothetical protein
MPISEMLGENGRIILLVIFFAILIGIPLVKKLRVRGENTQVQKVVSVSPQAVGADKATSVTAAIVAAVTEYRKFNS